MAAHRIGRETQPPAGFLPVVAIACLLGILEAPDIIAGAPSSPGPTTPTATADSCSAGGASRDAGCVLVPAGEGRWAAASEARGLRFEFTPESTRVLPLGADEEPWELSLSLLAYGGAGEPRPAGIGSVEISEASYLRRFGNLEEESRVVPKGLEHGIRILHGGPPAIWEFEFLVGGDIVPKVAGDGLSIRFHDRKGRTVLTHRGFRAVDAEGREVAIRWERIEPAEAGGSLLRLLVHAADHAAPIVVSSLLGTPKHPPQYSGAGSGGAGSDPGGPEDGLALLPEVVPPNDQCAGAESVPGAGPFPHLTAITDLTDATTTGDPPEPSCQANLSRSVWYSFTPAATADYTISACSDAPAGTTLDDTVIAVYSASGACAGLAEVEGGCDDDGCSAGDLQSVVRGLRLYAGTIYYVVVWQYGTAAPPPGFASVQLRVSIDAPPSGPPANDRCQDAELIPPSGPFPYLTSITSDVSGATTAGDPPTPSCQPNVSRSIWYSFTPAIAGAYTFSLCADAPTATTVDDSVMAIYSESGPCSGLLQLPGGCDDDSCLAEAGQSGIAGAALAAGTTYRIVLWIYDTAAPAPGSTAVQLRVSRDLAPPNDTCSGAPTLALDSPESGTTLHAGDDYRLPSGSACFAGFGQTASTAPGRDAAYVFTAPDPDRYSFRITGVEPTRNAVLIVASDCPAGSSPANIAACRGAANRNAGYPAEEVACLPMAAGERVFVTVDEDSFTTGTPFTLEVNRCREEGEPNDLPSEAVEPVCGVEGSIAPGGDADFYALGAPDPGSRVFAMVDGAAGSSTDFDLRLTDSSDTLEYDDLNNDVPFGSVAPHLAGSPLSGAAAFLRVSHYSAATAAEPYRMVAVVEPASGTATGEVEPNDLPSQSTSGTNLYFAGALSGTGDLDHFVFDAMAGELVLLGLDLDPGRNNTPFNGTLALLDGTGAPLLAAKDGGSTSSVLPGSGSLSATTPYSPGEAIAYRVRASGSHIARVGWSGGTPGDYLLSISRNCRVGPPVDLAVSQTDGPDPVAPGGTVTYSISVGNPGSAPAALVILRDEIPAGSSLMDASPSQGSCSGTGPLVCRLGTIGSGASATVLVRVLAPGTTGAITNRARVESMQIDPVGSNDVSVEATTVGPPDTDGDGIPDASDCAPSNPAAWAIPGDATGLGFPGASDPATLIWSPPALPGGPVVLYDLLRSETASDFTAPVCLVAGITATTASDPAIPFAVLYYLVRSRNACGGNVGTRSDGTPRIAGGCP
jgi:uncharacterized repeat protein (TIGR01451 family)